MMKLEISNGFKHVLKIYKILIQEELDTLFDNEKANNDDIMQRLMLDSLSILNNFDVTLKCPKCGEELCGSFEELFDLCEKDLNLNHLGCGLGDCDMFGDFKVVGIKLTKANKGDAKDE